jgi:hypothetical protein
MGDHPAPADVGRTRSALAGVDELYSAATGHDAVARALVLTDPCYPTRWQKERTRTVSEGAGSVYELRIDAAAAAVALDALVASKASIDHLMPLGSSVKAISAEGSGSAPASAGACR